MLQTLRSIFFPLSASTAHALHIMSRSLSVQALSPSRISRTSPKSSNLYHSSLLISSPAMLSLHHHQPNTSPSPSHNPLLPPQPCSSTPHPRPIPRQRLQLIIRIFLPTPIGTLHWRAHSRGGGRVGVLLLSVVVAVVFEGGYVLGGESNGCGFAAKHLVFGEGNGGIERTSVEREERGVEGYRACLGIS